MNKKILDVLNKHKNEILIPDKITSIHKEIMTALDPESEEQTMNTSDWFKKLEINPDNIIDDDGWRNKGDDAYEQLITKKEFSYRISISTINFGDEGIRKFFKMDD